MTVTPFRIAIPDTELAELKTRLHFARLTTAIPDMGWAYGMDNRYLRDLISYWREQYDWRAEEAKLNRHPQFIADIDGAGLHFIHARSAHSNAFPLVLTHGWPGSTHEFCKVIEPLVAPERHGGDPRDAFHVICPAIAGYGWSQAVDQPGCDVRFVAARQIKLMQALGYSRYGVQGGDWGSLISSYMAILAPDTVAGVHLNMCPAPSTNDPGEAKAQGVVPGRSATLETYIREMKGYAVIQGLKPDQLAYALNDSPVGLAAWIIANFYLWGDINGDIASRFDRDFLLTNVMIYWLTQSMPTAIRLYRECMRSRRFGPPDEYVGVPVGVAMFRDLSRPKRAWAERVYNIQHWTEFDRGGHFAALEEPTLFVDDIRKFFRGVR
jgi:epoxide hydrolase